MTPEEGIGDVPCAVFISVIFDIFQNKVGGKWRIRFRDIFKWHTQITGKIINYSLVYPLVFPRAWIKDILINPEAVKIQGLIGLQEPMSKVFAAGTYREHLQLNNKKATQLENCQKVFLLKRYTNDQ